VNEGKPKLVHLPDPAASASVTSKKVEAVIGDGGSAQLDWKTEVTGVSASSWRARYHAEATRKQRIQEDLGGEFAGLELASLDAGNLEDLEAAVSVHVKGKVSQFARNDGETLSVPVGPKEHMVREFAALSSRKQDLRLYAQSTTQNDWTVKLPASMKVMSAPKSDDVESPFGKLSIKTETNGGTVHVTSTLTVTKMRIPAAEYGAFRAWCERVDKALGQRLVVSANAKGEK
jgi:hypothetical protein